MCPLNIHVHDVIVLIFRIVFFCFIGSIERVEELGAKKVIKNTTIVESHRGHQA